jgi:hypothetical protein
LIDLARLYTDDRFGARLSFLRISRARGGAERRAAANPGRALGRAAGDFLFDKLVGGGGDRGV